MSPKVSIFDKRCTSPDKIYNVNYKMVTKPRKNTK